LSIEGPSDGESFGLYLRELVCPVLERGKIVVMDNLSVHRGAWVRELIEERGASVVLVPPYSLDYNPIEEAFSKIKHSLRKAKARTLDALFEATHQRSRRSARRTPAASSPTAATAYGGHRRYENRSRSRDFCGCSGVLAHQAKSSLWPRGCKPLFPLTLSAIRARVITAVVAVEGNDWKPNRDYLLTFFR
jgi:transposase